MTLNKKQIKITFSLLFSLLISTLSYSQACGRYCIVYKGKINTEQNEITTIKLPTVSYFLSKKKTKEEWIEIEVNNKEINGITGTQVLTDVYSEVDELLSNLKERNPNLPMILIQNETEIKVEIPWENVKLSRIKNEFSRMPSFELDLKELNLYENQLIYFRDTIGQLVFDSIHHNLGEISSKNETDKIVKYFKNIGDTPLVITRTWTNDPHYICESPREPLFPGEIYPFTICFWLKGLQGKMNKRMGFNLSDGSRISIHFKGERVLPEEIDK